MKKKNIKNIKLNKSVTKRIHHAIKMVVIPHKGNNFRPHIIRYYGLFIIILSIIGIQMAYNSAFTGKATDIKNKITVSELLDKTNIVRSNYKIKELKLNQKLTLAANNKAKDMFKDQYWSHISPDGVQPWKWLNDVDYSFSEAGENLAKSFSTTSAVMTAWMNSPGHKSNILNDDYMEVGFAVIEGDLDGDKTSIVVAFYGAPTKISSESAKQNFNQPDSKKSSYLTRFVIAIQSITSVALAGIILIIFLIIITSISHSYSLKMPKDYHRRWYNYSGVYIIASLIVFCIIILVFYSGGQI